MLTILRMQDLLHATTWWKACYAVPLATCAQMWRWGPVSCVTAGHCCRAGLKCSVLIRSSHRRSSHTTTTNRNSSQQQQHSIFSFIYNLYSFAWHREFLGMYSFYFWKPKLIFRIAVLIDHEPVDQSWYLHYHPPWAVPVTSWWPAMQVLRIIITMWV